MPKTVLEETKIREAAYAIWQAEGQPEGRDQAHWLHAIETLTAAAKPKAPRKAKAAPKADAKPVAKAKPAAKPRKSSAI